MNDACKQTCSIWGARDRGWKITNLYTRNNLHNFHCYCSDVVCGFVRFDMRNCPRNVDEDATTIANNHTNCVVILHENEVISENLFTKNAIEYLERNFLILTET